MVSVILLGFNINFFWSASIVLPDILNVLFLSLGIFFFLKFVIKKQSINYIICGCIFISLSFLTKPSGFLLSYFLVIFLLIFCIFKKRFSIFKSLIYSFLPFVFMNLFVSQFNYKLTGNSVTAQKGSHLLFWVYPCLVKKWGCGTRDKNALNKVKLLAEEEIKKSKKNYNNEELSKVSNVNLENKIYMKIFYDELRKIDKEVLITSTIGSIPKMLLHTSIIGIFERHGITYVKLKSILLVKDYNLTSSSIIWLLSQIGLIFLRLIQIIGFCNIFINNEKKYIWPIIFLSFFILPFLITTIGIGNPRYRTPIEPSLFLLTILGLMLIKKRLIPKKEFNNN